MSNKHFLAIDLGGTSAKCALINYETFIRTEFSVPTLPDMINVNSNFILVKIKEHIDNKLNEMDIDGKDLLAIGLTIPGKYNNNTGIVSLAPNINWKDFSINKEVQKLWPEQTIVCLNDADAAAIGEYYNSKLENIIVYTIGTGVGGAIIENGQLQLDEDGFSTGEFGHISKEDPKQYSNISCPCGQTGCLETVASARAINEGINKYIATHPESKLNEFKERHNLSELTTLDLNNFINEDLQDESRLLVFDEILRFPMASLANSIASIYHSVDNSERYSIFIAGGGTKTNNRFLDILKEEVAKHDQQVATKISISENSDKLGLNGIIAYTFDSIKQLEEQEVANTLVQMQYQDNDYFINDNLNESFEQEQSFYQL